jgi:gp16 family phage-associated protein
MTEMRLDFNENGILTGEQSRAWLFEHGITQEQVANKLGCHRQIIRDLLSGKIKGSRGKSHRAAVALRLKLPARGESPLKLIDLIPPVESNEPRKGVDRRQQATNSRITEGV